MATPWSKSGAITAKKAEGLTLKPSTDSGSNWADHIVASATSWLKPHTEEKKTLDPYEHDLVNDKYAPRAFAYHTRGLSSTFASPVAGGSFTGSPPRTRDKFIVTQTDVVYHPAMPHKETPYLTE